MLNTQLKYVKYPIKIYLIVMLNTQLCLWWLIVLSTLLQHLMSSPSKKKQQTGGLNGGSTKSTPVKRQLICEVESKGNKDTNM